MCNFLALLFGRGGQGRLGRPRLDGRLVIKGSLNVRGASVETRHGRSTA